MHGIILLVICENYYEYFYNSINCTKYTIKFCDGSALLASTKYILLSSLYPTNLRSF